MTEKLTKAKIRAHATMPEAVKTQLLDFMARKRLGIAHVGRCGTGQWAAEGAAITAHYEGRAMTVEIARQEWASAKSIDPGFFTAPVGTWLVTESLFMGKWYITADVCFDASALTLAPAG